MQGDRDVSKPAYRTVEDSKETNELLIGHARRSVAATSTRTTGEEAAMARTGTDLTQVAAAWIDAFNRADWDTLRGFAAPDVVYTETGTGRRVEGIDAYLELCQGWKAAFPDVEGTIATAIASGDTVAQELRWKGTHTGALQTPDGVIEPTGNRITTEAAAWIRYSGERVQEVHHYLDVLGLLQQIEGAGPDR